MEYKPHEYQVVAENHIKNTRRGGLILDMGLGKTVITLTAIEALMYDSYEIGKVLVTAPLKVAESTWGAEIEKWDHLKKLKISKILGDKKSRIKALNEDADIYIINNDNIVWLIDHIGRDNWDFDMLVVDELSCYKSNSAKRFKALRSVAFLCKRFVGLTGTPNPNGYMDLWSETYLVDRGERLGRTIGSYRNKYFTPVQGKGYVVYKWGLKTGAKELIDQKLKDIFISMSKDDYLDLKEPIECEVTVRMSDSERKLYKKMGRDKVIPIYEESGMESGESITAPTAATVRNKLQQMANGFIYDEDGNAHTIHKHKVEALKELVEASQGKPLLVFYWFKEDLKNIKEAFPEAVDMKEHKTETVVKEWNKGNIPILLCHPASAGHGLNLQEGGHFIIWYSLPVGNLELFLQANARLNRQGQKEVVRIYYILTEDTTEQANLRSLRAKDAEERAFIEAVKATVRGWNK